MKKASSLFIVVLALTFMGCSKGESDKGQNTSTTTTVAPASTTPAATAALNPPHGQPGHRCDIEVGAPLNTPALPQPNLQMPTIGTPAPAGGAAAAPAGGTTIAGTNPPHGEPGHDCAVPVGAPLNK